MQWMMSVQPRFAKDQSMAALAASTA